jgi:hypothetical protein
VPLLVQNPETADELRALIAEVETGSTGQVQQAGPDRTGF